MVALDIICKAEKKYLTLLEEFFAKTWGETLLWSHDLNHHRRVWEYAKEILSFSPDVLPDDHPDFVTKLLIACYLHDIGMAVDPGLNHGQSSRELCEKFLHLNHPDVSDSRDMLQAIENHDNKDYTGRQNNYSLLTILSAADDLDALGYIGICRYSEIYLLRGIDPLRIGYLIRENAAGRFENLRSFFVKSQNLFLKHRRRFIILDDFFDKYNREVINYQFGIREPNGHCGIIEILSNQIRNKISAEELILNPGKYTGNILITGFFNSVNSEIAGWTGILNNFNFPA